MGLESKLYYVAFLLDFTLLQNVINRLNNSREAFRAKQTANTNDSATAVDTIDFQRHRNLVYIIIEGRKQLEKLEIIFKRFFSSV